MVQQVQEQQSLNDSDINACGYAGGQQVSRK